jgi:hypothetical protein
MSRFFEKYAPDHLEAIPVDEAVPLKAIPENDLKGVERILRVIRRADRIKDLHGPGRLFFKAASKGIHTPYISSFNLENNTEPGLASSRPNRNSRD